MPEYSQIVNMDITRFWYRQELFTQTLSYSRTHVAMQ